MDSWLQNQHRHKRSFNEMSSHAPTLSPSPSHFSLLGGAFSPLDTPPPALHDRRTLHPHNNLSRPDHLMMPDRGRSPARPNLEHRTSQTIIDLTDEGEIVELHRERRRSPQTRLPPLERSDMSVIDLTNDVEEDDGLEITHTRVRSPVTRTSEQSPRRRHHQHHHRRRSPPLGTNLRDESPLFLPDGFNGPNHLHNHDQHPRLPFVGLGHLANLVNLPQWRQRFGDPGFAVAGVMDVMLGGEHPQLMPGVLDYGQHAFAPRPPPPKPEHQPPPKAREGYTRSPADTDVVICPACEEELVAVPPDEDSAVAKKAKGKPQSRKDREEHPFWVVRECGHVYCNNCYQHRKPDKKSFTANFPEGTSATSKKKVPLCAVEGCKSEVGDKRSWVGIFL